METQDASQRWKQVKTMLDLMLRGRFSHHIPQLPSSQEEDQSESVIVRLNLLAQQLESVFKRIAYLQVDKTFMFLTGQVFVLDKEFKILNVSKAALEMFKFTEHDLIGTDFSKLVHPMNREDWTILQDALPDSNFPNFNLRLPFVSRDGLIIKADCSVSEMIVDGHSKYVISFFETAVLEDSFKKLQPEIWQKVINKSGMGDLQDPEEYLWPRELMVVRELRDLILKNLHGPKPDLKEFAKKHGMYEDKLRQLFKKAYQATPSKYYRAERFHRTKVLLMTTDLQPTEIAVSFDMDYAYFSNTFKELFGESPTKFRKAHKRK